MDDQAFAYTAVDILGRRVRGVLTALDEADAYQQLRQGELSPLNLRPTRGQKVRRATSRTPSSRASADLLTSIADLLDAGADLRTALGILGGRTDNAPIQDLCKKLISDVGSGEPIDQAFGRGFGQNDALIAALVAAGEAAGDLPGALRRAAEMIEAKIKLRDQLVSVLAYPAFVLLSSIAALIVILVFVVPSIAPLAEEAGGDPPATLKAMIAASNFVTGNFVLLTALAGASLVAFGVCLRAGLLSDPIDRLLLDGPASKTVRAVVYGAFSISLGTMLGAGAPMSDALRLATRSAPTRLARRRLEPVGVNVRQGQSLSQALDQVSSFPPAISRLAAVGEATGSLGAMLVRAGRLEEQSALTRIQVIGQIAGPALIVALGILLGSLMAGLLSGISQMGQSALG